jgi:hypothetical protein
MSRDFEKKFVIIELRIPLVVETYEDSSSPDRAHNIEFHRQMDSSCTHNWFVHQIPELYKKLEEFSNFSEEQVDGFNLKYGDGAYYEMSTSHADVTRHRYVRDATPREIETGVCFDTSITAEIDFDRREKIRKIQKDLSISFSDAERYLVSKEVIEEL